MPKFTISIILPTFNRSSILSKTIKNILKQTFQDYELIVIDDGSNDNTEKIVREEMQKDLRIKYIKNINNMGCAKSREIGFKETRSDIIVFIDDDDQWNPNKLMKQYDKLMYNNSDMVISDYYINTGEQLILKNMNQFAHNLKKQILERPGPFFQCIMIKKNIIEKIALPFDHKSIPSEDWNFFIELSSLNPSIVYINEPLFTWNLHHTNQSLDLINEAKALTYIVNKHYNYIKNNKGTSTIANHYRRIARLYEKTKMNQYVHEFYMKAFKVHPLSIKNILYCVAMTIGYKHTKPVIKWIREKRGVPNV